MSPEARGSVCLTVVELSPCDWELVSFIAAGSWAFSSIVHGKNVLESGISLSNMRKLQKWALTCVASG